MKSQLNKKIPRFKRRKSSESKKSSDNNFPFSFIFNCLWIGVCGSSGAAGIGFVIATFGAIGFLISGYYLDANLPLSVGFVNIPAFLIFIPVTTFMARIGANKVHNMNKKKLQRMFGVFLYVVGTIFIIRFFNI